MRGYCSRAERAPGSGVVVLAVELSEGAGEPGSMESEIHALERPVAHGIALGGDGAAQGDGILRGAVVQFSLESLDEARRGDVAEAPASVRAANEIRRLNDALIYQPKDDAVAAGTEGLL